MAKLGAKMYLAMLLACLCCIFLPVFSDAEEELEQLPIVDEILTETEAVVQPEVEGTPAPEANDELMHIGERIMFGVIDELKSTPEPTPEVIGCIMADKSYAYEDYHLNPDYLDIPENGMPIPRIYQYQYRTVVCTVRGESKTVSTSGCGAASASMMIAYIRRDYDQTPYTLFRWACANGHYHGDGLPYYSLQRMLAQHSIESRMQEVSAENIISHLKANRPIIIKMGPGAFTRYGHYIVLRGLDENGMLLINDPNNDWVSRWQYSVDLIVREAKEPEMLVVYTKPNGAAGSLSEPKPTPAVTVHEVSYAAKVNASGVNLRQHPVNGRAVLSASKGATLRIVGETDAQSDGHVWCAIRYNGESLYIRSDLLEPMSEIIRASAPPAPQPVTPLSVNAEPAMGIAQDAPKGAAAVVISDRVNLRLEPVKGEVAAVADKGAQLNVLEQTEEQSDGYVWCRVVYENRLLYIRSDMLRMLS